MATSTKGTQLVMIMIMNNQKHHTITLVELAMSPLYIPTHRVCTYVCVASQEQTKRMVNRVHKAGKNNTSNKYAYKSHQISTLNIRYNLHGVVFLRARKEISKQANFKVFFILDSKNTNFAHIFTTWDLRIEGLGCRQEGRPRGRIPCAPSDNFITFPEDLTPFQMQKQTTIQASNRQRARSHLMVPTSSTPLEICRTFRLQQNIILSHPALARALRSQACALTMAPTQIKGLSPVSDMSCMETPSATCHNSCSDMRSAQ